MQVTPVIFLAFADESPTDSPHAIGGGALEALKREREGLLQALQAAQDQGLCELIVREALTIKQLANTFQDEAYTYRDPYTQELRSRISIFHFAGHAGSYQLLLATEDQSNEVANSNGLVPFLAGQESLNLVFLNGCSTQKQSEDLIDAGIPAVIGTTQKINDTQAFKLATQFYRQLGEGESLGQAWQKSLMALESESGSELVETTVKHRALEVWDTPPPNASDTFPWRLYLRKGSDRAMHWNLPEAARKPYFGLPDPQPNVFPEAQEPFPFLARYTAAYAPVYFGRGREVRQLYQLLVNPDTPPIILFHGASGVGKSSLLEAGVLPRIQALHEARWRRRDPEKGLIATLSEALGCEAPEQWASAWAAAEQSSGKPLHVVLDQVEESFTQALHAKEAAEFFQALAQAIQPGDAIQGKLILSYRKGYHADCLAHLEALAMPFSPLFMDRLDREAVREVVHGLAEMDPPRVAVEPGLAERIADDLLSDEQAVVSPVLQILLTKLWREAERTEQGLRHFTLDHYQRLKEQGIGLQDFYLEQVQDMARTHPEAVHSGLLLDLLRFHTTDLATAKDRSAEEIQARYGERAEIEPLVEAAQEHFLLAQGEIGTRLSHDTLGKIVLEDFRNSEFPGQAASRILFLKQLDFDPDDPETYLDDQEYETVVQGLSGRGKLEEQEKNLFLTSEEYLIKSKSFLRFIPFLGYFLLGFSLLIMGSVIYQALQQDDGMDTLLGSIPTFAWLFAMTIPVGLSLILTPAVLVDLFIRKLRRKKAPSSALAKANA